ncbi:MAG: hypothetical protein PUP92_13435 [Rhizonema sp. PD38]|nr:hypothetical protein [Rhizonema sp. PD38]
MVALTWQAIAWTPLVVCQPKIYGLGQAGEAGEAGGKEIFLGAVNPAKLT